MSSLLQDFRYSLRMCGRSRGFALVVARGRARRMCPRGRLARRAAVCAAIGVKASLKTRLLRQPQQLRRVLLRHRVQVTIAEATRTERLDESTEAVRRQGIPLLTKVG
jgi:hypothetical protein